MKASTMYKENGTKDQTGKPFNKLKYPGNKKVTNLKTNTSFAPLPNKTRTCPDHDDNQLRINATSHFTVDDYHEDNQVTKHADYSAGFAGSTITKSRTCLAFQ